MFEMCSSLLQAEPACSPFEVEFPCQTASEVLEVAEVSQAKSLLSLQLLPQQLSCGAWRQRPSHLHLPGHPLCLLLAAPSDLSADLCMSGAVLPQQLHPSTFLGELPAGQC